VSKLTSLPLLVILVGSLYSRSVAQHTVQSLLGLLPKDEAIQGWSRTDSARIYAGDDLFLHIDGGAVLFFEYGFQHLLATEYGNGHNESVTLEIYEMKDAGAAYGIYSVRSGRHAVPLSIGQEGTVGSYYVMFWKGNYYISLAASDTTLECRKALQTFARAVDLNISQPRQKPRLVELLPKRSLLKACYFRGNLGLSTVYTFDINDFFGMIDGVSGVYHDHTVFFFRYANEKEAHKRMVDIVDKLKSSERFSNFRVDGEISIVTDKKNQAVCVGQPSQYIAVSIATDVSVALHSCKSVVTGLLNH
jgi:hypothetical protein